MKQTCKQNRLPIVTVVLGCCALILRRVLYAVAVDVKNLLPVNHPLEIVLWVLTAIAAAWIIASVWKLDGSAKYEDNFQPSLMAAVGHYIAAAGILLTVLLGFVIERVAYKPLRSAPRMSLMISAIGVRNIVENNVDLTKSRNLVIAAVILVSGLGFSSGLTFTVFGTSITLTGLAIAALAGIILNAILPGNDYEFGKDLKGDINRGVTLKPNPEEIK